MLLLKDNSITEQYEIQRIRNTEGICRSCGFSFENFAKPAVFLLINLHLNDSSGIVDV